MLFLLRETLRNALTALRRFYHTRRQPTIIPTPLEDVRRNANDGNNDGDDRT